MSRANEAPGQTSSFMSPVASLRKSFPAYPDGLRGDCSSCREGGSSQGN
ncbi:predicted protein [Botrytis cinerea T4]|uniref:Uncharacterized protein n=1 Tax=Botryotinia fuckeliana (strain T4) TaxID=999810 RepID=G2XYZ5_BOTF4|nr:predicted protein [Botrytis cinerea T4]